MIGGGQACLQKIVEKENEEAVELDEVRISVEE